MPEFKKLSGKQQGTGEKRVAVRHLPTLIATIFALAFFALTFVRPNSTFAVSFNQPTATTIPTTVTHLKPPAPTHHIAMSDYKDVTVTDPTAIISTSWKKLPMKITASFCVSPMPAHKISSGMKAEAGR